MDKLTSTRKVFPSIIHCSVSLQLLYLDYGGGEKAINQFDDWLKKAHV